MLDLTKPLKTRGGRRVRIIATDTTETPGYPLLVEILDGDVWRKRYLTEDGRYADGFSINRETGERTIAIHEHDLVNA